MSYYEILLFLHIGTAIVWLGSGFFVQVLIFRAESADDVGLKRGIMSNTGWLAQRIFIPASLAVLIAGVLLTIEGPWSFGDLWIVLGLAGYATSFFIGILLIEPEGKRIHAAMEARDDQRAEFLIRRINAVSRIDLVVLYLVVGSMTLKPTGEDTGTLVVGAALVLAALAFWIPKIRAPEASAALAD